MINSIQSVLNYQSANLSVCLSVFENELISSAAVVIIKRVVIYWGEALVGQIVASIVLSR